MKNTAYNKNVIKHFQSPKNMGSLKNANAEATIGNPVCGDVMKIMLKIKPDKTQKNNKDKAKIEDIKFQTMGCAAAIATSSMTTVLAKGKTIKQAKQITPQKVAKSLGQLPPIKIHCSNLAADALQEAIKNWENKI